MPDLVVDVAAVAAHLRARTADSGGNEVGTFTSDTRPTAAEVVSLGESLLAQIARRYGACVDAGSLVNEDLQALLDLVIALHVELSYFPEQVANGQSAYDQMLALKDEMERQVAVNCPGTSGDNPGGGSSGSSFIGMPSGAYPAPSSPVIDVNDPWVVATYPLVDGNTYTSVEQVRRW